MYSIEALFKGVSNAKEHYEATISASKSDTTPVPTFSMVITTPPTGTVNPLATEIVATFFDILVVIIWIAIILWFIALFLLVKYWKKIPVWARVLGLICLYPKIPLGPVFTIIIVLLSKQN